MKQHCLIIKSKCLFSVFSWSKKSVSVKVYHMVRHLRNPYFCFPCKLLRETFECFEVKKSRNEYFSTMNINSQFGKFHYTLVIHWTNRSYTFNKKYPIAFSIIKNYIWHLVMKCNLETKLCKHFFIFNHITLCRIPYI